MLKECTIFVCAWTYRQCKNKNISQLSYCPGEIGEYCHACRMRENQCATSWSPSVELLDKVGWKARWWERKNNTGQTVAKMSFHLKDNLGRKANMDAAGFTTCNQRGSTDEKWLRGRASQGSHGWHGTSLKGQGSQSNNKHKAASEISVSVE